MEPTLKSKLNTTKCVVFFPWFHVTFYYSPLIRWISVSLQTYLSALPFLKCQLFAVVSVLLSFLVLLLFSVPPLCLLHCHSEQLPRQRTKELIVLHHDPQFFQAIYSVGTKSVPIRPRHNHESEKNKKSQQKQTKKKQQGFGFFTNSTAAANNPCSEFA